MIFECIVLNFLYYYTLIKHKQFLNICIFILYFLNFVLHYYRGEKVENLLKNKQIFIINIIYLVLILVFDVLLLTIGYPYVFKILASAMFVLCGLTNLIYIAKCGIAERQKLYKYLMFIGLVFAFLGDVFLIEDSTFIPGAVLFAVGHVFFFASYCLLYKINWRDVLISLAIFSVALIIILVPPIFDFRGMLPVIIVYAFIISIMLGKAVSNAFQRDYRAENLWIMIGSLLFFLSDAMLLFSMFTDISGVFHTLCLVMYYPAEFLLASSIYYANQNSLKISKNEEKIAKNH